ncbi:DUF4012 domain-containing protein [Arthrobacter sp. ISL-30]|uniref:DUF4012 domain-containing protein n=1 Tax=Arthrobacter sp. ISL-30 TaxID=2819109 RepID=UPI001BE9A503|nr:DUF4012 domain-containing protein [Arthrobacter sp. ISL-30]MBT2515735.1 DUF4012 domain-containing protein [Arthrobacter sp. ISL-30]
MAGLTVHPLREATRRSGGRPSKKKRRWLKLATWIAILLFLLIIGIAWLGFKASTIKTELQAAVQLVPQLKEDILRERKDQATATVAAMRSHTSAARDASEDPLWKLATATPWLGANFSAAAEIARSADDVVNLGVAPLVRVFDTLDWDGLLPGPDGANLSPIRSSATTVASAAHAVKASAERLHGIDSASLLPEIAAPLEEAREQLHSVQETLGVAVSASKLAPAMLGSDGPRRYLLLIQNNAEIRATGGIPGALAVLTADKGKLTLSDQTSASGLGIFVPPLQVDEGQKQIYSARLGKFVQDVNLTPDFPTSAAVAKEMWEKRKGQSLDGVISIDPVALAYILDATGPVVLKDPQIQTMANGLPAQLSGENVVKTLLSDVYSKITEPRLQDAYFAAVAGEIFNALSSGKSEAKSLMEGLGHGVEERRILVWSTHDDEQATLADYTISGAISGQGIPPAQFGVYFNDGTGAKMDYYVKRTVQLITKCPADGYSQVTVRVTSTNTAPADAATSLPEYVTGGGAFGIQPGTVQTNTVVYGPTQAHIEQAVQDGTRIPFNSQLHDQRPVGTVTTLLKPGQSTTVELSFDKIVQHTKPEVVVTPTTDAVKNVVMASTSEPCNSGK